MISAARVRAAILRALDPRVPDEVRRAVERLANDQTLLFRDDDIDVVPGRPGGGPCVISDRRLVLRPDVDADAWARALGDLDGRLVFSAGYGDDSIDRGIRTAGGVRFVVELDPARIEGRTNLRVVTTLDEVARETAAGCSVAMIGNAIAVVEAMVRRGFAPDVEIDLVGDRRVPDAFTRAAVRTLARLNPLEAARLGHDARERYARAVRALEDRGARRITPPAEARRASWTLDRIAGEDAAPRAVLTSHRPVRAAAAAFASLADLARGAAYVDLEGSALFIVESRAGHQENREADS